jgi:hypothetical protein
MSDGLESDQPDQVVGLMEQFYTGAQVIGRWPNREEGLALANCRSILSLAARPRQANGAR